MVPGKRNTSRINIFSTAPSRNLIEPPPRSAPFGTIIILAVALIFSLAALRAHASPWTAGAAILLFVIAAILREIQAVHLMLLCAVTAAAPFLLTALHFAPSHPWPSSTLIPILLYLAVTLAVPSLRKSILWMRPGRPGRDVLLLTAVTAVLSGIALYLWYRALHPDLSPHLANMPTMPVWLFPLAGLGFSLLNAAMEEFVFRGVVMQALDGALGAGNASITVQAWLFGAAHYIHGFPNGVSGLVMTFVYGVLLGAIRRRSGGMLAPWLAHACGDMVVFTILAGTVLCK